MHRRQTRQDGIEEARSKTPGRPYEPVIYLTREILTQAAHDSDRTVRVHAMRILGERPELGGTFAELVRDAIKDPDPHVRRAAADTLGRHPDTGNVKLLIALRASTPADDTHLIHVARMALRDQFLGDGAWRWLDGQTLTDAEAAAIADIATGVPTDLSAKYLFTHLKTRKESPENVVRYVHHIARYGDPKEEPALLAFMRSVAIRGLARAGRVVEGVSAGDAGARRGAERGGSRIRVGADDDAARFRPMRMKCFRGSARRPRSGSKGFATSWPRSPPTPGPPSRIEPRRFRPCRRSTRSRPCRSWGDHWSIRPRRSGFGNEPPRCSRRGTRPRARPSF